nr:hypothetical protein Iba_chr06fCG2290 [Ipomoea batatas]
MTISSPKKLAEILGTRKLSRPGRCELILIFIFDTKYWEEILLLNPKFGVTH